MKASELRNKSVEELDKELVELRKAQFSLRMQLATQQSNNTAQLARLRKDVARIKTILSERSVAK